jgi:hypothetical protein
MKNVTKPSISTLSLCISLLLLSGCGGNSQETTDNNKTDSATNGQAKALTTSGAYPEPNKDVLIQIHWDSTITTYRVIHDLYVMILSVVLQQ